MENNYQVQFKMKQASEFVSQGKMLHALQIYESIINEDPDNLDAYVGLSEIYEHMGNIVPAIDLLKEFLNQQPDNKEVRLYLGQFLLRNSWWDEAIDVLSVMLSEEEMMVSFYLGYSHFMLNEFELARICFQNFSDNGEKSELYYEANLFLAKIEIKLGDFRKAREYAKIAEGMYNNYWELNAIYAEIYYNLDMHAHAADLIEKAIKLNTNELRLFDLAGRIYFKLGDFYKAEKNFLKLVESSEIASSDAYTKLAEACMKGNKIKDALAYFDMALKIDPKNKIAKIGKKSLSGVSNKNIPNDV